MTTVCPQLVIVLFQLLLQVSFVQVEAMVTTDLCLREKVLQKHHSVHTRLENLLHHL